MGTELTLRRRGDQQPPLLTDHYRRWVSPQTRLTLVMLADVAREGVEPFQRYEAAVLPLLERHDGRLERRLRTGDGQAEVHIVSSGCRAAYEAYLADPERADHRAMLEGVALTQRLLEVADVVEVRPSLLDGI